MKRYVLLVALLAGCQMEQVMPAATPAPTAMAPPAPTLAPTSLPPATATPAPPTARPTPEPTATPAPAVARWQYPIGRAGALPADGFFMRHGFAVENTWFNPGFWHTGEDWYALDGQTAGAEIYAASGGDVVYVGANYPGRVVMLAHPDGLFSMYGHLDLSVAVQEGQSVERGALLGTVLRRGDSVPDHLHFEIRTFVQTDAVNGPAPRYGFRCGPNCPPGPGYWPMTAPDLPAVPGWRNPTHVINGRMYDGGTARVVVAAGASPSAEIWSAPPGDAAARVVGTLPLVAGEQFALLGIQSGPEDAQATGAEAYTLWYRLALPDGQNGWVQAVRASTNDTGSDGRASSVVLVLLPDVR